MKDVFVIDRNLVKFFSARMVIRCNELAVKFPSFSKYFDGLSDLYSDLYSTLEILDKSTSNLQKK